MGENMKYPTVLTQRYAKAETTNPTVTLQVVNLSNLKNLTPINVVLPSDLLNDTYMGGLTWASSVDLAVTITNRAQSKASTVLCKAPEFHCQIIHDELTVNNGWVIPADRIIFSARSVQTQRPFNDDNNSNSNNESLHNITNGQTTYEISNGRYILKRLPVRDGEHGYFRHVVFISSIDKRSVPLTMGRFEVTEIVGWDEKNEIVYFMAAPEKRPGERHLYKISLKLNLTKSNRTYITSSQPTCLTCDNTAGTYNLQNVATSSTDDEDHDDLMQKSNPADNHPIKMQALKQPPKAIIEEIEEELDIFSFIHEEKKLRIPNNCLYNKIYFSADFSYYVQECLGPDSPSVYLVETKSNTKVFVLNSGDNLRHRLDQLALPQIRTFSVEIRHGFHAQVRLFLPPGMREDEEVAFPLILQV